MSEAIVCDGCNQQTTGSNYRVIDIQIYENKDGGALHDETFHVHTGRGAVVCRENVGDKIIQFVAKHTPATRKGVVL